MTVEQRLEQLEKRNKSLTVALTMMAVVMCAVGTMAARVGDEQTGTGDAASEMKLYASPSGDEFWTIIISLTVLITAELSQSIR